MIIEDLLVWPSRRELAAAPEMDALTETAALVEAALIDVRLDATTSSAWLLFDCKGALQIRRGNTAVVVVKGVTGLQWQTEPTHGRRWLAVMGWTPVTTAGTFSCSVDLHPGTRLQIKGTAGEFYVGDILGGDDPPPNFTTATEEQIRAGLVNWSSDLQVAYASFTGG